MSTSRPHALAALFALAFASTAALATDTPGLGKPISKADIKAWDIFILPDGSNLPPGSGTAAQGEKLFAEKGCALCHGEGGKGDGPGGAALNPKPRNWTDHTYMGTRTDDDLYGVIFNGKGAMPAWGKQGILQPNEIRSAIMKVRTFDPQYKAPAKG